MLTEFAITPDVLEHGVSDWTSQEHLRALQRGIFQHNAASPVVIADLYDGSWSVEALKAVIRIKDQSARLLAQGFLTKLKRLHVKRPAIGDWPGDESGWVREAIAT